jgi:aldehyde dehydrogenase (NAD+)
VVHERVANGLLDRVMELAQASVVGDGVAEGVTMGPLASAAQLEKHREYVGVARADGGHLETPTHECAPQGGYFVRPTIFTGVRPEHRVAQEEVFTPILAFLTVASYDEAVEVVNGTPYGLSVGIITGSVGTALRFAHDLEAGVVKVNQPTTGVAMNAPFGGLKRSSTQTSREQGGASMMTFYTREKTLYLTPED